MTIDLGFAWVKLPSGGDIGFVDVPGHQDFIRNMLAGIGSIDAVLLVVAADEGVMPQTREHLAILGLLGIERGVIALTKRDLVDDEWAALAVTDVRAALRGTALADAPLVEVSSTARLGLDELLEASSASSARRRRGATSGARVSRSTARSRCRVSARSSPARCSTERWRSATRSRCFPAIGRGRIRGLQTHRRSLDVARPGSRVAANVTGVEKQDVLARHGARAARIARDDRAVLAVRLALLASASAGARARRRGEGPRRYRGDHGARGAARGTRRSLRARRRGLSCASRSPSRSRSGTVW